MGTTAPTFQDYLEQVIRDIHVENIRRDSADALKMFDDANDLLFSVAQANCPIRSFAEACKLHKNMLFEALTLTSRVVDDSARIFMALRKH